MPKEVPGLKKPHSTSKMLPTITYRQTQRHIMRLKQRKVREGQRIPFIQNTIRREGDWVLTLQSKQLKEEWKYRRGPKLYIFRNISVRNRARNKNSA